MNYAIILAGGTGSRFWPLSSEATPKQFLNICSEKPLITETINRILPLIKKENIYIATNKNYNRKIQKCLHQLKIPAKNVLFEPEARSTFAPIGYLSSKIYAQDKDAVILVTPSDHYVSDKIKFVKLLDKALVAARQGHIVTLGIIPDRPETGYGYIKVKSKVKSQKSKVYSVSRFVEKPTLQKAKRLIQDKRYFWNGGIFIFQATTMLEEIRKFTPSDYALFLRMRNKQDISSLWPKITSISIDFSIMEKTKRMALLPLDFGWMDLGSWQAIEFFSKKDKDGNIFKGECIDFGSKNILAWSDNRIVATLGLEDIVIVNTKNALLVCAKDKTQDVKKIVQILRQKKLGSRF